MSRAPQHRPLERHRVRAAINEIQKRIDAINEMPDVNVQKSYLAASLRGKRVGYLEAQAVMQALYDEVQLPHRWWRKPVSVRAAREVDA